MIKSLEVFINKYAINKKRIVLCISLFIIGAVLCSAFDKKPAQNKTTIYENSGYSETEQRLCSILEKIKGVGSCDAMITYMGEDIKESDLWGSNTQKQNSIQGVVVVASGADNDIVKRDIINAVSALLDVEICNIKVYPQK